VRDWRLPVRTVDLTTVVTTCVRQVGGANCHDWTHYRAGRRPKFTCLFRHQMSTFLTSQRPSHVKILLISEHECNKSLEVYQQLSRETAHEAYQEAVQSIGQ
jgi:hypothetical protein